jgi:hypothetical protein
MAQIAGIPYPHTFHSGTTGDGDGTPMDVGGLSHVGIQVSGMGSAIVYFEANVTGSTYYSVRAEDMDDGSIVNRTNQNGLFVVSVKGLDSLRCRIASYVSGSINVDGKGIV